MSLATETVRCCIWHGSSAHPEGPRACVIVNKEGVAKAYCEECFQNAIWIWMGAKDVDPKIEVVRLRRAVLPGQQTGMGYGVI